MSSVALALEAQVATLTLEASASGYDGRFLDALAAAAGELRERRDEVRAVVVRSADADFGTGWAEDVLVSVREEDGALAGPGSAFDAMAAVPQPTVASLHGRVHSAGLELALACDIRIAASDTTFAMPETGLGMIAMAGGTQRLPRAIGRAHALRLLLTGDEIDADEAKRIGLVSSVVPVEEAEAAARAVAETIAQRGPIATRFAKEAIHRGAELTLEQALRHELDLTVILQTTADRAEGVRAFVERREPRFEGH